MSVIATIQNGTRSILEYISKMNPRDELLIAQTERGRLFYRVIFKCQEQFEKFVVKIWRVLENFLVFNFRFGDWGQSSICDLKIH